MNQPKLEDEEISPQEKQFWERMNFRQFCLLFIRMQAIWLLLNTAIDLTYLPPISTGCISTRYIPIPSLIWMPSDSFFWL